jgi:hypothetical protein
MQSLLIWLLIALAAIVLCVFGVVRNTDLLTLPWRLDGQAQNIPDD